MTSVKLPFSFKHNVLAVGSETNTTFSLLKGDTVFLSEPYQDIKDPSVFEDFRKDILKEEKSLHVKPDVIACDMHPEYISSKYARDIAENEKDIHLVEVQHHHAHIAACMAENGLKGKAIGVAFDGTGYGDDGKIWGGEFLIAGYKDFERAAHIAYIPMPGGDKAVFEPMRMVLAYLYRAYGGNINKVDAGILERLGKEKSTIFKNMIDKEINSPLTSSAGRLFDVVSSLVGIKDRISYEGEAAIMLEEAAKGSDSEDSYKFKFNKDGMINIEFNNMIKEIVADVAGKKATQDIARKFHNTLAAMIAEVCVILREKSRLRTVILSGGVFQNKILSEEAKRRLLSAGFKVYLHSKVATSDRGVSLGQAVIAASKVPSGRK